MEEPSIPPGKKNKELLFRQWSCIVLCLILFLSFMLCQPFSVLEELMDFPHADFKFAEDDDTIDSSMVQHRSSITYLKEYPNHMITLSQLETPQKKSLVLLWEKRLSFPWYTLKDYEFNIEESARKTIPLGINAPPCFTVPNTII